MGGAGQSPSAVKLVDMFGLSPIELSRVCGTTRKGGVHGQQGLVSSRRPSSHQERSIQHNTRGRNAVRVGIAPLNPSLCLKQCCHVANA